MANKIDARISLKTDGTGKVVGDVRRVTDSFRASTNVVDSFKKKLNAINVATKITAVASAMSIAGGVIGGIKNAVGGVVNVIDGFATKADSLSKFSRNVGLSVEQLQQWQYASQRSGMTTDQFNNAIRKFSVNVSKAVGGEKKQVDLFNALGVSLRKSNGEIKGNNELMLELAGAYEKIGNAQDKMRVSEELFGRGATGIGNLFENGEGGLRDLLERRRQIGGMFSDDDAKNAEGFKDLLLDVSSVVDGIKTKIISQLMPTLNQEFKNFLKWWEQNGTKVLDDVKIGVDVAIFAVKDLLDLGSKTFAVFENFDDVVNGLKITFNEYITGVKNDLNDLVDWWRSVPVIGKIVDFVTGGKNEVAQKQVENPTGATTTTNFVQTKNTTTTSKVLIDVTGNKNTNVDVDPAFSKDPNVGLNFGYTFGY